MTGTYHADTDQPSDVLITCTQDIDFAIIQAGATFHGLRQGASRLTCLAVGQASPVIYRETDEDVSVLLNGQLTGLQVSFRLGDPTCLLTGTVTGSAMSGSATRQLATGHGEYVGLSGQWSAVKL